MKSNKKYWKIIFFIMCIGAILRIVCCFWGRPYYQLHPDEGTIVNNAIDMLFRHSWEAYVYNRPDQFEIKCCALIFQIGSYLRYHIPAYEAFAAHQGYFYVLARLYTAFWGIMLIPLSALLAGEIYKKDDVNVGWIQVFTAGIFAFSYIFIQHSGYATPDVTLTFFVVAIAYCSIRYIKTGANKDVYFLAALTGIATTIKYPAIIMAGYIALIVVCKKIQEKKFLEIIQIGVVCLLIALATMWVIAPNLFTDFGSVVDTFRFEARSTHLGADRLGFFGNMRFYFEQICESMGSISLITFCVGIIQIFRLRKKEYMPLLCSALYWIFLSVMKLHWQRWGVPMYVAYVIISVAGFFWMIEICKTKIKERKKVLFAKSVVYCLGGISVISICMSGIGMAVWSSKQDARILGIELCQKNNVTVDNSIAEGYTPLSVKSGKSGVEEFELTSDGIRAKDGQKEYFVMTTNFLERYQEEPKRYKNEIEIYKRIEKNYTPVFKIKGWKFQSNINEFINIKDQIENISNTHKYTGCSIYVYDLKKAGKRDNDT